MILGHVAYECARLDVKHNFIEIKLGEANKTHGYNCQTVPSSRSLHSMWFVSHSNNVLLETKQFSCFCDKCVDDTPEGDCESQSHVVPWILLTL